MLKKQLLDQGTRILRLPNIARRGVEKFAHLEAAGSLVLMGTTILAIVLANSSYSDGFFSFWEIKSGFVVGEFTFKESFLHWINDAMMALFFFVVGLEIKREILVGELSTFRKAILPIMAAIGGMVIPAVIYFLLNTSGSGARGWGIPMATDIAFALGILALLGSRIPLGLKVFLTALAIADDIGAILVIALFYTAEIHWNFLFLGIFFLLILVFLNWRKNREIFPYLVFGVAVWFSFFESGIHATIAGVLVALTIPTKTRHTPIEFVGWGRDRLDEMELLDDPSAHALTRRDQNRVADALQVAARHIQSPLRRIEHSLHPWTTFAILPLFALANAGISLSGFNFAEIISQPISLGIILGLVVGKPIGITLFSFLAVKMKLADLPFGVSWRQVVGASFLGGIGFTMSIFVSNLAFEDPGLLSQAKLAIIIASLIAGFAGYFLLLGRKKG